MVASVRRAMAITAKLNRLNYEDAEEIRALFSELIGKKVDARFSLIPPFYSSGGGRNGRRELGCRRGLRGHQGRSREHPRRGKSGSSHSVD